MTESNAALHSDVALKLVSAVSELRPSATVDGTVEAAMAHAPDLVACEGAGVMLVEPERRIGAAGSTTAAIERVEELQVTTGEGPCLTAIDEDDTVLVDDSTQDARWPGWASAAADVGLRSVASVPLATGTTKLGALNLYSESPRHFRHDDVVSAGLYARFVTLALVKARNEQNLRRAVDARTRIGQAQGILMQKYGLDADQAFAVLRRYSQDHNVKLRTVAGHVVDARELPGTASGHSA